ncbi:hypothetical protein [Thermosynechococcus sp. FA-CM-4201]
MRVDVKLEQMIAKGRNLVYAKAIAEQLDLTESEIDRVMAAIMQRRFAGCLDLLWDEVIKEVLTSSQQSNILEQGSDQKQIG